MVVIASIHQPSTATFNLFSKLLLLSRGKTVYFGPVDEVGPYMTSIEHPVPPRASAPEFILQETNVDFAGDAETGNQKIALLHKCWEGSSNAHELRDRIEKINSHPSKSLPPLA